MTLKIDHHRARRRRARPRRRPRRGQPVTAGDQGDCQRQERRLDQAGEEMRGRDRLAGAIRYARGGMLM